MTTNLPSLSNTPVPAYLANRVGVVSTVTANALSIIPSGAARISIKAGRFRVRDGQDEFVIEALHLDCVIVGAMDAVSKVFYLKPYSPGDEPTAPDCSSQRGDKPLPSSPVPQSESCATCKQNEWGSKVTPQGKEIQACSNVYRLAIVSADDPSVVYLLAIPGGSIKAFQRYTKELSHHGYNMEDVTTRLTFDMEVDHPKLKFSFAGFIADDAYPLIAAKAASTEVQDVLGAYTTGKAAAPAQAEKPKLAVVAPPPPPPVQQAAPEPVAVPAASARKGFGKAAAPAPQAAPEAPAQAKRGFGTKTTPVAAAAAGPVGNSLAELESQIDNLLHKAAEV